MIYCILHYDNSHNECHALREAGRVEDSLGDKDSNTMERLKDGQVKLGPARHEH
jgi:hypothetical protein